MREPISMLVAGLVTGAVALHPGRAGARPEAGCGDAAAASPAAPRRAPERDTAASWRARRGLYFQRNWGVDLVGVRRVASGHMLRLDYRVVDPERARALTDRKARPYVIDEETRTALAVPALENVGELRQVAPLEARRTYFVLFGNPGGLVRRGGRVTLVVGNLRAEAIPVE